MRSSVVFCYAAALMSFGHTILAQAPAGCTDQQVFSQCLKDEDIYLKTCKDGDFICLCKWNTAKLQCWDNSCPNDPARATQAGLVESYCGIAKANSPTSATSVSPTMVQANIKSSISLPSASSTQSSNYPSSSTASSDGYIATPFANAKILSIPVTAAVIAFATYLL